LPPFFIVARADAAANSSHDQPTAQWHAAAPFRLAAAFACALLLLLILLLILTLICGPHAYAVRRNGRPARLAIAIIHDVRRRAIAMQSCINYAW
jgi:hypothetical protein